MKKLSFVDFLTFTGVAVAIVAVYLLYCLVKFADTPTTTAEQVTIHNAAHECIDSLAPCAISERVYLIFGNGDLGLMVETYLMTGQYTDQLGNPCTKEEFQDITGIDLETYPL
jgi:hypothetical protein